jgi:hypothetical protein
VKRIIFNIALGTITFHVIMSVVYHVALQGLLRHDQAQYDKFNLLFSDGSKQDVVLLGSSRTYYGINSFLLEQLSQKKVVNAGLEGAKLNEMELALKGYLFAHPNPEKLLLMIDPHSFGDSNDEVYNKIYMSHYLKNDSLYENFRKQIGYKSALWKWLPYSIISEFDDYTRMKCLLGTFNKMKPDLNAFNYKGFSLLRKKFITTESDFDVSKLDLTEGKIFLYNILKLCALNDIEVQVIQGPFLQDYYNKNKIGTFYDKLEKLIHSKFPNVKVQRDSLNYDNLLYFKDETHLNDIGSTKYTLDLFTHFIK